MQRIAGSYRGQNAAAYQAAAQRVRFPYWDWAVDAKLPPSVTMKTISITTPQGKQTVRNPLYSYKFRRSFSDLGMPNDSIAARFTETKRGPQDNGSENIDGINAELERYGGTLRSQVVSSLLPLNQHRVSKFIWRSSIWMTPIIPVGPFFAPEFPCRRDNRSGSEYHSNPPLSPPAFWSQTNIISASLPCSTMSLARPQPLSRWRQIHFAGAVSNRRTTQSTTSPVPVVISCG